MRIKQVVFSEKNKVLVSEAELNDSLAPDQVLIATARTMVSPGTELAALTCTHSKSHLPERAGWLKFPSTPGYLATGTVAKIGSAVKLYKPGDKVVCEGAGVWNSHVSHLIMNEGDFRLIPIPQGVSFSEAVFTKMGSIAMTGVRVLHPEFGDSVAVMGLGLVGQVAVRLAALAGGSLVVGVDPMEKRRALALKVPGVKAVAPDDPILTKAVVPGQPLSGFDHVIEASGHPSAFLQACEITRIFGKIAALGGGHKTFELRLYDNIHARGLQILGAHGFVLANPANSSNTWTDAKQRQFFMQLLAEKKINVQPLITHEVSYSQAPEIYQAIMEKPADFLGTQFIWNE